MKFSFQNKLEACQEWVKEFNVIPTSFIEEHHMLIEENFLQDEEMVEITMPTLGDQIEFFIADLEDESDLREVEGVITTIDVATEQYEAQIVGSDFETDLGNIYYVGFGEVPSEKCIFDFPTWKNMYVFDTESDKDWINETCNQQIMSKLGFKLYRHEYLGIMFGIDKTDGDFYKDYWLPLYEARELNWHTECAEDNQS